MTPWVTRAQEDSLKRIQGIEPLDLHFEPCSRRHDRRKPRGRLRAEALVPDPSDIGAAGEVVLTRFVGDEDGPAPRLSDVRLRGDEAEAAFAQRV